MKYTAKIQRTVTQVVFVEVEAENPDDAEYYALTGQDEEEEYRWEDVEESPYKVLGVEEEQ